MKLDLIDREVLYTYVKYVVDGLCDYQDVILGLILVVIVLKALRYVFTGSVPKITVQLDEDEAEDEIKRKKFDPKDFDTRSKTTIKCWDPSTMDFLGNAKVTSPDEVRDAVKRARKAQETWKSSTFEKRKYLMRIMLRYIVENQETIARVAVRESGKTVVDAAFGEILVTCEKLKWLAEEGEQWLQPENRTTGTLMMMKRVRVEYQPFGVIGAIVPWNYPFHNVFNPLSACLFSGNAIVIKVSEYSSWSVKFFKKVIQASLKAANAPLDLVQFVTGFGETGNALVTSGADKIIFVGSPGIGIKVMEAAAKRLTPVVRIMSFIFFFDCTRHKFDITTHRYWNSVEKILSWCATMLMWMLLFKLHAEEYFRTWDKTVRVRNDFL